MNDLSEFLLARTAEDEERISSWYAAPGVRQNLGVFKPAQALAGCEAKRRIVELHSPYRVQTKNDGLNWDYMRCGECAPPDEVADGDSYWPCVTLRLLTLPYAGHPDYRSEWAP